MRKQNVSLIIALLLAAPVSVAMADPYTFTTITLPPPPFPYPGASNTRVIGVNDVGQIVGYIGQSNTTTAFIEDLASGTVTTISGAGTFGASAYAINTKRQVVGDAYSSGRATPYLRDPVNGAITMLPLPEGFLIPDFGLGLNDSGQIVGASVPHFIHRPLFIPDTGFLYDLTTGMFSYFSDPASATSFDPGATDPADINNRGQVVGSITSHISATTSNRTGFLLDLATNTYTALDVPGSTATSAYGINDKGQVVGDYLSGATTSSGFLLDLSTGIYTTLTDPGAISTTAYGINNAGQIVGSFTDSTGIQHGFVATPTAIAAVPEPASIALLGSGICALAWARRRATGAHKTRVA